MNKALVSVIIPTYSRTDFLAITLKSVVGQSYDPIEIIVVDDGSKGDDNKILCDQYQNVTYLKIENSGGPSKPRNKGIKLANGKYIAFLDDDDIWLTDKIAKQVEILEHHKSYGLVHGYCKVIDQDGNYTHEIIGRPGKQDLKHGDVKLRMAGNWTLMMPTPLVRKEVIDKIGYFNEQMPQAGEDVEFWVRCSFITKFYYLDEPLALYRKHESNSQKLKDHFKEVPKYLKKVIDKALDQNLVDKQQHIQLTHNLIRMQIKKSRGGILKTFGSLFQMNPLWFLKFDHIKLLLRKIFTP